ncbi:hypothetical protein LC048_00885 [Mesobacillus subterraneus]|uniref:hypothetical protein n=1 Tax=Mesobacillus subterraneus TaxID=285983 RepID=UPI001CFD424B|nr:hypothetical protein [Mesobacillus subterraneus]WLR55608.1 hypothetical protein LC048_00885 [Mesobacillus subterraneus]
MGKCIKLKMLLIFSRLAELSLKSTEKIKDSIERINGETNHTALAMGDRKQLIRWLLFLH